MPCYANTIVKIKVMCQTKKRDTGLLIVWAVSVYPIERENNEMEIVLFVSLSSHKRDFETQAILKRTTFILSVIRSCLHIMWEINDQSRAVNSNRYLLKVSLVGVPQESPQIVRVDENVVISVLISDYTGQDYNFIVKAIFPHKNSRFVNLMNIIQPQSIREENLPPVSEISYQYEHHRAVNSNRYLLKVSLVGVPQESPQIVRVDENVVISVLISDYTGQDYNFIVKAIFPHKNSRFVNLMNIIQPQRSFVFVVRQIEVIDNEFYIYSKDINYINNVFFSSKQKAFNDNSSPEVSNTARSKLLLSRII
ncbi:hypothetical protein Glove_195g56 [Diversispora epigaea]|uniref:Uncharacterized protein n=1 Tax=Diversispora epigaea TaxID=1348612 RepID=A0A397IL37_9GLOM|nr:hypothetical protein Glove_195g56 [Diversispora epigaea]